MPLSCSCDFDYEFEEGDWYYDWVKPEGKSQDFYPLETSRARRCCSCGGLIHVGDLCVLHPRVRYPYDELESRKKLSIDLEDAMSEEATIRIAPHYQCEKCAEIWLNLQSVGFSCLSPSDDMQNALREYQETYHPPVMK